MERRKRKTSAAVLGSLLLVGVSAQATDEFNGAVNNDWANGANWGGGEYPTGEEGYLNTYAELSGPVPTNMWAFRMGQTGDAEFNVLPGAVYTATEHSSWGSWLGLSAGYEATINQSGGSVTVTELEVGSQAGSFGYYELSGGTTTVTRSIYERSLYVGATKQSDHKSLDGGTGTFTMTGGTLLTQNGVSLGHPSYAGEGTFEVFGTGPDEIGIGSYSTNDHTGSWSQYSNSTLRVGISPTGITPIHINGGADDMSASVFFADGSILDVSFIDGALETGSWPVMVCEGTMVNAGMVFADSMGSTTNDWGFMVTNNILKVGYGLGWPAGYPTNVVVAPSPGRTLYWTGNAGDTDSSNADNWALDTAGTPATWGIYNQDSLHIGHSSIVDEGVVSVVDYEGTADYTAQSLLYIGNNRTGILNINSGTLTFITSSTSRQQVGLGGVDGDGTLNVNDGSLSLNTLRVGIAGSKGTVNINSGSLGIARSSDTLDGLNTSITLGFSSAGTGDLTISGGSLSTRGAIHVGYSGGTSTFAVEGSGASLIEIGKENNTLDGAWVQHATGILKILVDEGGVTPIQVRNSDNSHVNGGDVYFSAGSLLDISWMEGVTNYNSFDVMTWGGQLVEDDLAFAPSVDTDIWSFAFVDTNADTTNDTLRVTAYGETANGTPYSWLNEYGLTEADDHLDTDGDGLLTWEEYIAGTNPTNAASVLTITSHQSLDNGDYVVTWQSVEGKSYSVITNTSLLYPQEGVAASDILGLVGETSYTGTISGANEVFYEIGVE
ncbi:MAG: hypothetical protein V5783_06680 [Pontiella sp.]